MRRIGFDIVRHKFSKSFRAIKATVLVWPLVFGMTFSSEALVEEHSKTAQSLAHYIMGQVQDLMGNTKDALLEYQQASQIDASNYLTHLRLGSAFARLDMFNDAESELKRVNELNEKELQSHHILALIYSAEKKYDEAAKEYEYIIKTSPDQSYNIEIYAYLGQLYFSQKKYEQAVAQFEKIIAFEPNNIEVMFILGSLYMEINRLDDAVTVLKKALTIDPNNESCQNTLAYVYSEKNENLDEALSLIQQALKTSPYNGAYLDTLGWVYFKKEMYDDALKALLEANKFLSDPILFDHLGDVYLKLNQPDKAKVYWEKAKVLSPELPSIEEKINQLPNLQIQ